MKTSNEIDQLAIALVAAQSEIETAPKDKINPHFKSRYADLTSVWEACRAALGKYGLAIIQSPSITADRFLRITTRILHKSGQWIEGELDLRPTQDTPQAVGSAITYGRRYSLASMLGVVSDDDDDGNAASAPKLGVVSDDNGNASSAPKNKNTPPPKLFYIGTEPQKQTLLGYFHKHNVHKDSMVSIAEEAQKNKVLMNELEDFVKSKVLDGVF